jgi:hypothetical protein
MLLINVVLQCLFSHLILLTYILFYSKETVLAVNTETGRSISLER